MVLTFFAHFAFEILKTLRASERISEAIIISYIIGYVRQENIERGIPISFSIVVLSVVYFS